MRTGFSSSLFVAIDQDDDRPLSFGFDHRLCLETKVKS